MKKYWKQFTVLLAALAVFTVPALGADKAKDEETLKNASTVLSAMLESNAAPADLLDRAYCVVIAFPPIPFCIPTVRRSKLRDHAHL